MEFFKGLCCYNEREKSGLKKYNRKKNKQEDTPLPLNMDIKHWS